ncbi:O-methyltransferase [Marininema mesophilum]|uniref:O-methyltransferase n=1 Tax=Marininema mesophilum TaxID=1048340 RepID=A0A1H3B9M6_9BACL|nr:TylF/MycF family methyltransferase [Marininema mesophilum]SDX38388.1 O-methyltransferase [Marininema mesophilum]
MNNSVNVSRELYLELLKKSILNEIYLEYEPDANIISRHQGRDWPAAAHSMIGRERMNHLQTCLTNIIEENIEGDVIETGVWRGGACIFMRGFFKACEVTDRLVWVADSFEGLPKPDSKYPMDASSLCHTLERLKISLEEVKKNFEKYDLLDDQVKFLKGWFKDTLPTAPIEKIAIARLDGDMYSSTIDALNSLYAKVSPGGYVIIDDFSIPNCSTAVHDFRKEHGIKEPIVKIDWTGVYWKKSKETKRI